jgi:hypothetical protein
MKKLISLYLLFLIPFLSSAQELNTIAFKRGEKITYRFYYHSAVTGNVTAGELVSEIKPYAAYIDGNPSYHVVMEGKTKGAFNWFFKIRDRFETYIDEHKLAPRLFKKRIKEGDYETSRDVRFEPDSGRIFYHNLKNGMKGTVHSHLNVQDIVSSLYYIRNWDFSQAKPGHKYYLNIFIDDSIHKIQFEYIGLQKVETKLGKIECLTFKPHVLTGNVFAEESPMTVYVSNDANHLPIFAVSKVMVGSVRMELIDYQGLKYKLAIK